MAAKLRDVSSSSSEAESDAESESFTNSQPVQERRQRQGVKYHCPADFVSCNYSPCPNTRLDRLNDDNTELWLIKAPVNFDPDSLSGSKLPLVGLEVLQPRARNQQVYSVLSRPAAPANLCLLTTHGKRPGDTLCGPAFSGLINICENYGDCQGNQEPVSIPACPAPQIPEGLKQRFQPFGSKTPATAGAKRHAAEDPTGTCSPTPAKRIKPDPDESEDPKKKKKKKKDKSVKTETEQEQEQEQEEEEEEVMAVAIHSSVEMSQESIPEEGEQKKKKKKKNKDKTGEVMDQSDTGAGAVLTVKKEEEVEVKIEPEDPAYGDVQSSEKKKKKKKKKEKEPLND